MLQNADEGTVRCQQGKQPVSRMSLAFKQAKHLVGCRPRDRDLTVGNKGRMLIAGEGEEARGPADRKAFGDDVPIAVAGELEHDMAVSRHGVEQLAREARMVARYERGESRLRIGLSIVEAFGRVQENQRRGIGSIRSEEHTSELQ